MRTINYLLILIIISLLSCKKVKAPENKEIVDHDYRFDGVAVTKQTVNSVTGNTAYFQLEIAAMQQAELTTVYPDEMFRADTFTGNIIFTPLSVQRVTINEAKAFQTMIIVDASNDRWTTAGVEDFVSALNRLYKTIKNEDSDRHFGIGFFGRDITAGSNVDFLKGSSGNPFSYTEQEFLGFINDYFVNKIDPSLSPSVYDAINSAMDELIANPITANKSVTVLTGNLDDGLGSATVISLLSKAAANNISIHFIEQGAPSYNFYRLVHDTKGFIAESAGTQYSEYSYNLNESSSHTYHLYEMLAGIGPRYLVDCKVTKGGNWIPNTYARGTITAYYFAETGGDFLTSDLDVNQKLPIHFKIP